ncbi:hypothetical protein FHK87_01075 [Aquimarina algicola]|uniref:Uncharacterized protein n=1 Tax=Aquimarina algicola TaxID=2589995 RepID=A0A504JEP4_9FLAO|nr:hypothetical protein FHK87_01075 [Aquimarina algicola]
MISSDPANFSTYNFRFFVVFVKLHVMELRVLLNSISCFLQRRIGDLKPLIITVKPNNFSD